MSRGDDDTPDQYPGRPRRERGEAGSGLTVGAARGIGHRLS
ncbi:hypothetical protein [Streptomyces sp. NPDC048191]